MSKNITTIQFHLHYQSSIQALKSNLRPASTLEVFVASAENLQQSLIIVHVATTEFRLRVITCISDPYSFRPIWPMSVIPHLLNPALLWPRMRGRISPGGLQCFVHSALLFCIYFFHVVLGHLPY